LVEGAADGRMSGSQTLGLARNADGLILMVDLSQDPVEQFRMLESELDQIGIFIDKPQGQIEIIRRGHGVGIQISGGGILVDCTVEDIRRMLNTYKVHSALVRVRGRVRLDDIEDSLFSSHIYKPTLVVANKLDVNGAKTKIERLRTILRRRGVRLLALSCKNKYGLNELGEILFQMLKIIRVYTKVPLAKEPTNKPIVVEDGTNVIGIAKKLHSELYKKFKFARMWGPSAKYPGEKVGMKRSLKDGDILEIH
jgi:ribosome-interacting GTPase 1